MTDDNQTHTDALGQRYRLGFNGRRDYLDEEGESLDYTGQRDSRLRGRYAEAIQRAAEMGQEPDELFFPGDIEHEFFNVSTDDTLIAVADVVTFVSETLASGSDGEELTGPAEHGLFRLLEHTADQIHRVLAYQQTVKQYAKHKGRNPTATRAEDLQLTRPQ